VSAAHRFALRCARDDALDSLKTSFIRLRSAPIAVLADQYRSARNVSDKSGDKLGDKVGDNLGDNLGDGFLFAFGIKGLAKPLKKMVNGRR
jgi:hypothetical protein